MFIPAPAELFFDHYYPGPPREPRAGVSLAGNFNAASGKLESLPAPELERIRGGYDVLLIEGDGSRALPLKGWADHEPQVPPFTTITAGVIPLSPLGKPLDEKIAHRLPRFCALSGASPGEILRPEHLAAAICGAERAGTAAAARGLFASARGKRILFINQVEDEAAFDAARGLAALLPPAFRAALHRIIAGSARLDTAREL
jgi:probable selenium-dependent hydroxylase accessory protein YqeC